MGDITHPGPNGVNGGKLTKLKLKRVDSQDQASVDKMLTAVCGRLLGKGISGPSTTEEALAWAQAATFLSGRIQASSKLMSNCDKVVLDITNPGPSGVDGGQLTQRDLKRVDRKHQTVVDAMVKEMCGRLLGKKNAGASPERAQVWADAATFLNGRIQQSAGACPGRAADMSQDAATAMRTVLAQITS